eukprot:symbB.v1.2.010822.t1/scaffold711.1/size292957/3
MLRQICVRASSHIVKPQMLPAQQQLVRHFAGPVSTKATGDEPKPFRPASPSEPDLPYVETPSMLYMTAMIAVPCVFSFWFCTRLVAP